MNASERSFLTRRKFLTLGGVGALGVVGGVASAKIESTQLVRTFKQITGLQFSRPIRVLHLSDFHASAYVPWSLIRKSVEMGMGESPDLVVLTGDYVTSEEDTVTGYAEALSALKGHPHCFASFGNHDGRYSPLGSVARQLEAEMEKVGVQSLVNRAVEIEIKGQSLRVVGLGDIWRNETRPDRCLSQRGAQGPRTLLLSHNPDSKTDVQAYEWDVMFSGHTHGGQIRVPIVNWAPYVPTQDRSMVAGIYRWDGRHIHITRGVGNLYGIRLFCAPEVSLVDLT